MLDDEGRSDFGALQRSLGGRGGKLPSSSSIYVVFDLLYCDGHDLQTMELSSRRHLLEQLLADRDGLIQFSEENDGEGGAIFRAACGHCLDGIIFKDADSAYRSGRTADWIKVNCIASESFFIVGYEKTSTARNGLGSLLLVARK